jgi:hypothetical protein
MSDFTVDDAAQIAQTDPTLSANTEPGFTNTYTPYSNIPKGYLAAGVPLAGVGALGLMLLYKRHQEDQQRKKLLKAADWQSIKAQLPGVHAKDILLGAAAGAGGGALYDLFSPTPKDKKKLPTALRRILTGAAIGGVGANVVGDRARRYISNVKVPIGYGSADLTPKSFAQFGRAFFADKPAYDPEELKALLPAFGGNKAILDDVVQSRRELTRRSFGVHSDAGADYWQKNKGGKGPDYYSLNEKAPDYLQRLNNLFMPSPRKPEVAYKGQNFTLSNPQKAIAALNNAGMSGQHVQPIDIFGSNTLVGDQQLATKPDGKNLEGRVLDRWDVTPTSAEKKYIWDAITGRKVLNPRWYGAQAELPGYSKDQTNTSFIGSLLGRLFWDNVLTEEHPWVSQRFRFTEPKSMQLMNEAGTPQLELEGK